MNEKEQGGTSPASSCARVQAVPPHTMTTSPARIGAFAKRPVPWIVDGPVASRGSNQVSGRYCIRHKAMPKTPRGPVSPPGLSAAI